ncbi:MAG: Zn-dependent exopeptidase M28 [Actinobacteria bacterium]|nr:MAG: Zn-dependent exopeptidase M28 [Actinomycetota bacterium]
MPDASAYATAEQATPTAAPEGTGGRDRGIADWLGLGRGFDARKKGREIGSWDNFGDEGADDADEIGWKGGAAPAEDVDDPEFAAAEAARIRKLVTERADRDLVEKEVWFVATGAEEVGTFGMRAFLAAHKEEASDAVIINIDNVGAGKVHYITSEGMVVRYHCDRRLASAAKRVAREEEMDIRGKDYRGLTTDATPALARGFRAMSVMAFDINGRIPNWHWKTDTVETCSEEVIDSAADFVAKLIRGL